MNFINVPLAFIARFIIIQVTLKSMIMRFLSYGCSKTLKGQRVLMLDREKDSMFKARFALVDRDGLEKQRSPNVAEVKHRYVENLIC